ncbi:sensor histidine kinase YesM [Breznakia sp. PF5-3]|uniref:GHKL domain-containing protein n=1 Tax=unclassified Breznakia TaxID=2623764 RepID=UPI0024061470|nr:MULTISPECIES: GHKL domain-containing protein [unclassified Breznakia]MDF9824506.1 sensor histidine kinase YesM [Breznakia sp. PM6-1]MDF9835292.1 sensor histidine kinase YesM [Breznakia sp. PF5-3]MDF9837008.1 sensor histidine kinase YesM [Breznakia sp. PFB2-8]MDF9858933.1 sensor histidine kinase YesM [Breznakia sp. PH5-24]
MNIWLEGFFISAIFGASWIYSTMKLLSPIFHKKGWFLSTIVFVIIQIAFNYIFLLTDLYDILYVKYPFTFALATYSIQFIFIAIILYRYYHNAWKILSALGFTLYCMNTFHTMVSYSSLLIINHFSIPIEGIAASYYNIIIHSISSLFGLALAHIFTKYSLSTHTELLFKTKQRKLITTIICVGGWNMHEMIFVFYPILPLSAEANLIIGFVFLLLITIIFIIVIIMQNNRRKLELQKAIVDQQNFHINELSEMQIELYSLKHDIKNLITSFLLEYKNTNTEQLHDIVEKALSKSQSFNLDDNSKQLNVNLYPIRSFLTKENLKKAFHNFFQYHRFFIIFFCSILGMVTAQMLYHNIEKNLFQFVIFVIIILLLLIPVFICGISTIIINLQNEQLQQDLLLSQQYYFEMTSTAKHSIVAMHEYYQTLLNYLSNEVNNTTIKKIEAFIGKPITSLPNNSNYHSSLKALHNIKIPEVKNLLLMKCSQMIQMKIPFKLEVIYPIHSAIIANIDLIRSLGILLDNAIEESINSDNAKISIIFLDEGDSIYININNVLCNVDTNLKNIYEYGYSSKGKDRGIGLFNYKKIIGAYSNVITRTKIRDNLFIQELTIQK